MTNIFIIQVLSSKLLLKSSVDPQRRQIVTPRYAVSSDARQNLVVMIVLICLLDREEIDLERVFFTYRNDEQNRLEII